jgi:hypothetical protein
LHSTYFQNDAPRGSAAAAKGLQMQNDIEMKNNAVEPLTNRTRGSEQVAKKIPRTQKISGSGFTREEMRQIVAEQID